MYLQSLVCYNHIPNLAHHNAGSHTHTLHLLWYQPNQTMYNHVSSYITVCSLCPRWHLVIFPCYVIITLSSYPRKGNPPLSKDSKSHHRIHGHPMSSQGHNVCLVTLECPDVNSSDESKPRPHSCIDLSCPCPSPHSPGLSATRFSSWGLKRKDCHNEW